MRSPRLVPIRRRAAVTAAVSLVAVLGATTAAAAAPIDRAPTDTQATGAAETAAADPVVGSRTTVDPPSLERHVGDATTLTVAVALVHESGATEPAAGVAPGVWLDGRGSVVDDGCVDGTGPDGSCAVTVASTAPGASEVVAGTPEDLVGPATAVVRWVDHGVEVAPADGTVDVGGTHQVTVTLTRDDGVTVVPAAGLPVSLDLSGHGRIVDVAGGAAAADGRAATCTTTEAGSCVVDLASDAGGGSTLTAVATSTVGGVDRELEAIAHVTWSAISAVQQEPEDDDAADLDDVEIGEALVIERTDVSDDLADDLAELEDTVQDGTQTDDATTDDATTGDATTGDATTGDVDAAADVDADGDTEVLGVVRDRRVTDGALAATGTDPLPLVGAALALAAVGAVLLRSTVAGSGRTRRAESRPTG